MTSVEHARQEGRLGIDIPVYTPGVFDAKLQADPGYRRRIAAFTTVGFEHFNQGHSVSGFRLLPHGERGRKGVFAIVNPETTRQASWAKVIDLESRILDSRRFGDQAAYVEAIVAHSTLPFEKLITAEPVTNLKYRAQIRELLRTYDPETQDLTRLTIFDDFSQRNKPAATVFAGLGISAEQLPSMKAMIDGRAGVQVFFENTKAFWDFEIGYRSVYDSFYELNFRPPEVPGKLILAVVPLGPAEQEALR